MSACVRPAFSSEPWRRALNWACHSQTCRGRIRGRRPGHPHRAFTGHAGRAAQSHPQDAHAHQETIRCQPNVLAHHGPATVRQGMSPLDAPALSYLTYTPQYAQVIVDEKVPVCETAGGPAAAPIIQMLRKHGVYVIHKCTSVRHAKTAARLGANMLSIDGFECAGHPGEDDIGGIVLVRSFGSLGIQPDSRTSLAC